MASLSEEEVPLNTAPGSHQPTEPHSRILDTSPRVTLFRRLLSGAVVGIFLASVLSLALFDRFAEEKLQASKHHLQMPIEKELSAYPICFSATNEKTPGLTVTYISRA